MRPDFDALYELEHDPWQVGSSWYEQRKLAVLLAALPRQHYSSGWEPACGLGLATERLARRCDRLTATDSSGVAVRRTRARCAGLGGVNVSVQGLPLIPATAPFDLVVAAEFLYYLPDFAASVAALWRATRPGGHLVFLHWRHSPQDGYVSGESLHLDVERDADARGVRRMVSHAEDDFRLDIYEVA